MTTTSIHPLILKELSLIDQYGQKTPYHTWKATLYVKDQPIQIPLVSKVHIKRDYLKDFGDRFRVIVKCDSAMYSNYIYPHRDNLKLTLVRKPVYVKGAGGKVDQLYQYMQYDAILVSVSDDNVTGVNPFAGNKDMVNSHMIMNVEFQITSRVLKRLKGSTLSTNVRASVPIDAIRAILTNYSRDELDLASEVIEGVDVAPGYSTEEVDQVLVPQGTSLVDVPQVIHQNGKGIYQTGFSYYLQGNYWYVFSPFDVKRFEQGSYSKALTIINVPKWQVPAIEKTYRDTGTQLIVIANGDTKQMDTTERAFMNQGVGAQYANADKLLEEQDEYKDGKVSSTPRNYISAFTGTTRPDGVNPLNRDVKITANPSIEYGKIAERRGMYFGIIWDNAAPESIYPGMPVKYVYISNGLPVALHGTVVGISIDDTIANADINNPIFSSTCFLKVFLERSNV